MNAIENTIHGLLLSVTGVGFVGLVVQVIIFTIRFGR
jgi:Na+-transporting methylmalonyl-CoA/oxaloacetate decarboxylase gamma subunit